MLHSYLIICTIPGRTNKPIFKAQTHPTSTITQLNSTSQISGSLNQVAVTTNIEEQNIDFGMENLTLSIISHIPSHT